MILPIATYRLQFRTGMTFARAAGLIPHWQALGISHVYASPIFAATYGSAHGYDVIDPNLVEPEIGGRDGFDRFSAALKEAGLGLILDIVPNHLAASLENPWWRSVVELGADSPYAGYFDIDWKRRLTLAVMSGSIEDELAAGNIRLVIDRERAALAIDYLGSLYPLHPATYRSALASLAEPLSSDTAVLADTRILDLQPWCFIPWQEASNTLSYRRFFEITGLAGVRVEQPEVFEAMHRTVLDMVRRGQVQGLRIDHIDGLADPEAYLVHLRAAVGRDVHIVVEKILERDERLPEHWPVEGTTGYEFIASLADVMVNHQTPVLDEAYRRISPENADPRSALRKAREQMIDRNFRGEVSTLKRLACEIADAENLDIGHDDIEAAVREVLIAFPVYRTYGSPRGLHVADINVLKHVFDTLERVAGEEEQTALRFVHSMLMGDVKAGNADKALRFRTRMQHLTGPLLAKALEDTFFYRYNRLLALNEVGGDPLAHDGTVERFHRAMQERAKHHPLALTATATHDTKRGEDARARLYTISEAADVWGGAVERWRGMHRHMVADLAYGPAPEPNTEWMLYQALAGVWPPGLDIADEHQLTALRQRFLPYVDKTLREAKLRADWTENNQFYEMAVARYAEFLLSPDNSRFLGDFAATLQPFVEAGICNSLVQTLLKLSVPGIPDIYQGCEGPDFSLVDPDNRRIPDFEHLADSPFSAAKRGLVQSVLSLRKSHPRLFSAGAYIPLKVSGDARHHVIAFGRADEERSAVVIVSRLILSLVRSGAIRSVEPWRGTEVMLPKELRAACFRDVLTGGLLETAEDAIGVDAAFARQPFALLMPVSTY